MIRECGDNRMKRKTGRESGVAAYQKEGKQFHAILRIFFFLILASLHSFMV
jgi:hypothetical protein